MDKRENILRAIRFEKPEYIPIVFAINSSCWEYYDPEFLQDMMEGHKRLFPGFKREAKVKPRHGLTERKDAPYKDPWGCVWETAINGITGSVHEGPLSDWAGFESYRAPDPDLTDGTYPVNWDKRREHVAKARQTGDFVGGGLPHGHTFLRLQYIRGYENLMYDMLDGDPRFLKLLDMVEDFNCRYVAKWMELKPDMMSYPEDLGMQVGPMVSPELFRKYIKPVYKKIMKPARDQGCIVHMHSDGDIRTLVDDLVDGGVEVINLQDLVNGIDWIAGKFAGHTCIDLDIDRQSITARGTPAQIDSLIREEVEKLGSKKGGLMMIYGLYPGVPLANIRALMDAMERYMGYYS